MTDPNGTPENNSNNDDNKKQKKLDAFLSDVDAYTARITESLKAFETFAIEGQDDIKFTEETFVQICDDLNAASFLKTTDLEHAITTTALNADEGVVRGYAIFLKDSITDTLTQDLLDFHVTAYNDADVLVRSYAVKGIGTFLSTRKVASNGIGFAGLKYVANAVQEENLSLACDAIDIIAKAAKNNAYLASEALNLYEKALDRKQHRKKIAYIADGVAAIAEHYPKLRTRSIAILEKSFYKIAPEGLHGTSEELVGAITEIMEADNGYARTEGLNALERIFKATESPTVHQDIIDSFVEAALNNPALTGRALSFIDGAIHIARPTVKTYAQNSAVNLIKQTPWKDVTPSIRCLRQTFNKHAESGSAEAGIIAQALKAQERNALKHPAL